MSGRTACFPTRSTRRWTSPPASASRGERSSVPGSDWLSMLEFRCDLFQVTFSGDWQIMPEFNRVFFAPLDLAWFCNFVRRKAGGDLVV